jgi:hypothetical protein
MMRRSLVVRLKDDGENIRARSIEDDTGEFLSELTATDIPTLATQLAYALEVYLSNRRAEAQGG